MPPKIKITKENILSAALAIVRESGAEALNARTLAGRLECSTQPIFSNYPNMENLKNDVLSSANDLYLKYLSDEIAENKYPQYKASGMAYIRFAQEERELFKLLFMRDRQGEDLMPTADFHASVDMIMAANHVTKELATRMHLELWTFVHGIGTMIATSFFSPDWELISDMLTDVYQGLCARHANVQMA